MTDLHDFCAQPGKCGRNRVCKGFYYENNQLFRRFKGDKFMAITLHGEEQVPRFSRRCCDIKTAYLKFFLNTVLVTFVGTDITTLPSQCWLTRLARKIPKNNIERGEGSTKRTFSTWLSSVPTKLVYNCR